MKVFHPSMSWGVSSAVKFGAEDCLVGERSSRAGGERGFSSGGGNGHSFWTPAAALGSSCHYSKSRTTTIAIASSGAGFRKFKTVGLKWQSSGGGGGVEQPQQQQEVGRRQGGAAERSICRARDSFHASWLDMLRPRSSYLTSSPRTRMLSVRSSVGFASLGESKSGSGGAGEHAQEEPSSVTNYSEKPPLLSTIPESAVSQVGGKAGSISFYARRSDDDSLPVEPVSPSSSRSRVLSLLWLLGPCILVASVVLPPLYLRKFFAGVLEDSLVTDFVILFFTETLFFTGAGAFLYIAHISRQATAAAVSAIEQKPGAPQVYPLGYRLSAKIALAIGVLLPFFSFVIVWPWTGPAAAAALAPYMIGLLVQLGFERIIHANDSPVWPLVPVTFQMYRLHQLNRAAQLVAGLLFSLRGVESTAETMAITGSLQTLLLVLQVLGMLCLWTLGSFLTNQMPTKLGQRSIPSLP